MRKNWLLLVIAMVSLVASVSHAETSVSPATLELASRLASISSRNATSRAALNKTKRLAAKSPDYTGFWAGRFVPAGSTCTGRVDSFLFRHSLYQQGGSALLSTSHDGTFSGQSRDKGRRIEFGKTFSSRYGPLEVAVFYKNLSKNRRVTGIGYVMYYQNYDCYFGYVANGIRQ